MHAFPNSAYGLFKAALKSAEGLYPLHEAEAVSYRVVEEFSGMTMTDIMADKPFIANSEDIIRWQEVLHRLRKNEPVQYIFNRAWFYERPFYVNPSVLIPRQETEELVFSALELLKPGMTVLDIGTGSGCIPITLKLEAPDIRAEGCDISVESLEVAKKNAAQLNAQVDFFKLDILNDQLQANKYNLLISNPPYVTEGEKAQIKREVLEWEPHQALFVTDQDPLLFYKKIAKVGKYFLDSGGHLLFEINERFGKEVVHVLESTGYKEVQRIKDLNGKDRIVKGICI